MKDWFLERQGERGAVESLLPGEKGGSYPDLIAGVSDDAVVLQLPTLNRLIAFHAGVLSEE